MMRLAAFLLPFLATQLHIAAVAAQARDPVIARVRDPNPDPGDRVAVVGAQWARGSMVRISLDGTVLGEGVVGHDGRFETSIVIPADAEAGGATVRVEGRDDEGQPTSLGISIRIGQPAGPRGWLVIVTVVSVVVALLILVWVGWLLRRRATGGPEDAGSRAEAE